MRVAIYVRVSTSMQAEEGYSLDAQIDRCKAYAISQGWEVVVIYVEEGESAKDLERTEIKRMISDAADGLFDVLLVYKLDRLTRSVRDLHRLLDLFDKHNIKFRSASEVYDTTSAMGRLFITIVSALAQWERENLGERVRFGKEQQVKEGNWPGGPVPYGYEWDGETMHIVPDEYVVLRELRRIYMAGNGLRNTALLLNRRGMLRRDSKEWSAITVCYVLENPFYAGKIRFGSKDMNGVYPMRKNTMDAMITDSGYPTVYTWEEYVEQTARLKKRAKYGNSNKTEYWFAGVLRCSRCGSRMKGRTSTNRRKDGKKYDPTPMYMCSSRHKGGTCNMPMIRQVVVEDLLMTYIGTIMVAHSEVAASAQDMVSVERDRTSELEQLNKELRTIQERRKKWQYMFAEDMISEVDFRSRKREDDEQEQVIKGAIDELRASTVGADTQVLNYVLDLPRIWQTLSDPERKEWMQTIFDSVHVNCDEETGRFTNRSNTLNFRITEVNYN